MRLLITGGRNFDDRDLMWSTLDRLHAEHQFTLLIHGDARGTDRLAGEWAQERGIAVLVCPADRKRYGRAAGPKRNRQMLAEKPAEVSWKRIARRWEILRLVYNVIVGLAGLLTLGMIPNLMAASVIGGVVAYGFCANVMYLLGPVTEMYLNWIVDAWEGRLVPRWLAGFVRSRYLTGLLFAGGCLFSVGLTLAIGLSAAFASMLPNQQ